MTDHQQGETALAAHHDARGADQGGGDCAPEACALARQPSGERESPVHGSHTGQENRTPGNGGALRQLLPGEHGQQSNTGQADDQRGHPEVARPLGHGVEAGRSRAIFG